MSEHFCVGDWHVDPVLHRVRRGGETADLEPKVMHVLRLLAEHSGAVVPRDRFFEEVWSDTVVTDHVLTRAVSELRQVFGDSFRDPRYIETIPKTGYRLVAPVTRPSSAPPDGERPTSGDALPAAPVVAAWTARPRRAADANAAASTVVHAQGVGLAFVGGVIAFAVFVAVSTLAWHRLVGGETPPVPPVVVPMTSAPGLDTAPRLSPDGAMLAFLHTGADGRADLYVRETDGDARRRLTTGPHHTSAPVWADDGRTLLVRRWDASTCRIVAVSVLDGTARRVAACGRHQRGLDGTPDGRTLVVSDRTSGEAPRQIVRVDVETGATQALTRPPDAATVDFMPRLSPDGREVAFLRGQFTGSRPRVDLFVVPLDAAPNTRPARLTTDRAHIAGFAWTPSGRGVVVSSNRGGNYRLWRVDRADGNPTWLAHVPTVDPGSPTVVDDRIAFVEWDYDVNVWTYSLSDDSVAVGTPRLTSTRWDYAPRLSPDGRHVAFGSSRSGAHAVWIAPVDGGNPRRVALDADHFVDGVAWTPDGRRLVASVHGPDRAALVRIDADDGHVEPLDVGPGEALAPSLSRDGAHVYFASARGGSWEVWRIPLDGADRPRRVTTGGGLVARETPDGRALLFTKRDAPGLWRQPLDGSASVRILDAPDAGDAAAWDVTPTGLFVLRRTGDGVVLTRHAPATGAHRATHRLGDVPLSHIPGLAVSDDGRTVWLSRVDHRESDVVMVRTDLE